MTRPRTRFFCAAGAVVGVSLIIGSRGLRFRQGAYMNLPDSVQVRFRHEPGVRREVFRHE